MQDRVKPLEGVRNFRDFGGYKTKDGGLVRKGRLFRSGHYNEATDADISALADYNVTLQVDLRRPDERERQPNRWPNEPTTILTNDGGYEDKPAHIAFLEQDDVTPESVEGYMSNYYDLAPYKPHMIELYRDWFAHLPDTAGGALVNCAAGKDRTGILCALTLDVLGVDQDTILEDYLLTNAAVDIDARLPLATEFFNEQLGKSYDPDVYRPFMGVREVYLATAYQSMTRQSGSPQAYVKDVLGVDQGKADQLRAVLLEG